MGEGAVDDVASAGGEYRPNDVWRRTLAAKRDLDRRTFGGG